MGNRMRWLDAVSDSVDMSLNSRRYSEGQGSLVCCSPWAQRVEYDLEPEQQQQSL